MDASLSPDGRDRLIRESWIPESPETLVSKIDPGSNGQETMAEQSAETQSTYEQDTLPPFLSRLRQRSLDQLIPDDDWRACLQPAQAPGEIGRLDDFIVTEVLGAGGMGVVLGGRDARLNRPVAIKVMRPALSSRAVYRDRFLREARAMAAIDHPNVVPVYCVGEHAGMPFMVMKRLTGETLAKRMRDEGPLPEPFLRSLALQVADGLAAAHASGTLHRDVKPGNIWLESPDDHIRLLDFGLALPNDQTRLTSDKAVLGTPAYMSPEQARGGKVDERTDFFSLGAVLYEAASGKLPFAGDSIVETLSALANDTPVTLKQASMDHETPISGEFSATVMGLLKKDPDQRIASASGLRTPLLPQAIREHSRRSMGLLVGVMGTVLLFLGVTILQMRTPTGMIVVELADGVDPDAVTIEASNAGKVTIMDVDHGWTIDVQEGQYTVAMLSGTDQFVLDKETITVTRDGKAHLCVARRPLPEPSDANIAQSTESPPIADRVNRIPTQTIGVQESFIRWVFSVGGSVQIRVNPGHPITIEEASEIPGTRPLEMHTVNLTDASIRDQDIDRLAEAGRVYRLYLGAKYGPRYSR
ncbi:MAG: serine/threonine-protein kinase [Planctomycetota bacterium]